MSTVKSEVSSPALFVAYTIAMILGLFFAGHIGLVGLYRLGTAATVTGGAILATATSLLFIWRPRHRFFALLAGTLLWAVLGEATPHLKYGDIVSVNYILLIPAFIVLFVYLLRKNALPSFAAVTLALFLTVWASHSLMVNSFETFGKNAAATKGLAPVFVIVFCYALYRSFKSRDSLHLTLHSILMTCCAWSMLEYLWAWQVLPKPW
jgi:hypothetical protein